MELWSTAMEWLLPCHPSPWKSHQWDPDPLIHLQMHPTSRETKAVFWSLFRKATGLSLPVFLTTSLPCCPGFQWLLGVQDVVSLCLTPLLPELSKPKCNLLCGTFSTWDDAGCDLRRPDVCMCGWVTSQQSWCCAWRFPAVKICSHSVVHETTKFTNNTFSALPMRSSSKPACDVTECGFMQGWKNCQWKCLHRLPCWFFYFHHLVVLMKWAKGAIYLNYCNVFITFQLWL